MHGLVLLACGLLFSAPSSEDVGRALRDVLAEGEFQTEYPDEDPARTPREAPPPPRSAPPRSDGGSGTVVDSSGLATTFLWVLAGIGVVLVVVWLARELKGYNRAIEADPPPAAARPRPPPAEAELPDAAALAAEGRYDEAVHLLLLHALRRLEEGGRQVSSDTSREVIGRAALEREARGAALALADAVDLSLFGGRPVDEAAYRDAVETYQRFRAACA